MLTSLFTRIVALAAVLIGTIGVAMADEGSYVRLDGDKKVLALRGVLQRVLIAQSLTSDGFKSNVYRDVEYPITRKDNPNNETDFEVWASLSGEYNDPPLPGAAPAFRGRREVREPVKYIGSIPFRGHEEFVVNLTLDYSGEQIRVSGNFFCVEGGGDDLKPATDAHSDFMMADNVDGFRGGFTTRQSLTNPPEQVQVWINTKEPLRSAFAADTSLSAEDRKLVTEDTIFLTLRKKTVNDE